MRTKNGRPGKKRGDGGAVKNFLGGNSRQGCTVRYLGKTRTKNGQGDVVWGTDSRGRTSKWYGGGLKNCKGGGNYRGEGSGENEGRDDIWETNKAWVPEATEKRKRDSKSQSNQIKKKKTTQKTTGKRTLGCSRKKGV